MKTVPTPATYLAEAEVAAAPQTVGSLGDGAADLAQAKTIRTLSARAADLSEAKIAADANLAQA